MKKKPRDNHVTLDVKRKDKIPQPQDYRKREQQIGVISAVTVPQLLALSPSEVLWLVLNFVSLLIDES